MKTESPMKKRIIKPYYFSNWGDTWGYPAAFAVLPYVAKVKFLTPNVVSIIAFIMFTLGSLFLFIEFPYHLLLAGILLILGFIGDDLDGQVARYRGLSSKIGDYMDKTMDILKIFIITASLGLAAYFRTGDVLYIFLAFAADFFFHFRYYIKLETMFQQVNRDKDYLDKSAKTQDELEQALDKKCEQLNKQGIMGKLHVIWIKHHIFFWVDEAEFAFITAVCAWLNQIEVAVWILAISQTYIAFWRLFQRGYQINTSSPRLLWPLRK